MAKCMGRLLVLAFTLTFAVQQAEAAPPGRWGAGLLLGISKPSDMGIGLLTGLELNAPVLDRLMVLATLQSTSRSVTYAGTLSTFDSSKGLTLISTGAVYQFRSTLSAGARLGIAKFSASGTATGRNAVAGTPQTLTEEGSGSGLFIEPVVVYEVPAGGKYTLGGELGYVHSLSASVPGTINLLGVAKYWF